MEALLEVLVEGGLQILWELLCELGLRRAMQRRAVRNAWLAAAGYALLGAVAGWLSSFLFPKLYLTSTAARWANLLLTPIVAGTIMATLGHRLGLRHRPIARRRRFTNACSFAFAMALVRMLACG